MAFTEMSFLTHKNIEKYNEYSTDITVDQDDDIIKTNTDYIASNQQPPVDPNETADNYNKRMADITLKNEKIQKTRDYNDKNGIKNEPIKVDITDYIITINVEKDGNHIQSDISKQYQPTKNPYIQLLEDFNETSGVHGGQKKLKSNDFMYLRDIGVYPINRMMILRRFTGPPGYDLNPKYGNEKSTGMNPISTVIGWVKPDDNLFNFSFNEVWKTQSKWLHELIREIINDQFGIDVANIFPIPGWGQGFLFGMMNQMGMTDYNAKTLPLGDADLLREGVTRETEGQGLVSSFSFTLETCYELKYINGVDPTVVFHNIMKNLLEMGTSKMHFLFKGGSSVTGLMKFVDSPDVGGLVRVVEGFVYKIINGLKETMSSYKKTIQSAKAKGMKSAGVTAESDQKKIDDIKEANELNDAKASVKGNTADSEGNIPYTDPKTGKSEKVSKSDAESADIKKIEREGKSEHTKGVAALKAEAETKYDSLQTALNKFGAGEQMIALFEQAANTVLASTIGRYKWPLKGAVNQSTGMVVTPWHLTIGNPYSPVISMNNIKVDNVEISFGKEMMFNDLPKYIHTTIKITQARNMGKQEIMRMFGVTYKRNYSRVVTPIKKPEDYIISEEIIKKSNDKKLVKHQATTKKYNKKQ